MPDARLSNARATLPDDYVYVPPRPFDDRLIAVCPLCEEVLTADHDCQDAHEDADAETRESVGRIGRTEGYQVLTPSKLEYTDLPNGDLLITIDAKGDS